MHNHTCHHAWQTHLADPTCVHAYARHIHEHSGAGGCGLQQCALVGLCGGAADHAAAKAQHNLVQVHQLDKVAVRGLSGEGARSARRGGFQA